MDTDWIMCTRFKTSRAKLNCLHTKHFEDRSSSLCYFWFKTCNCLYELYDDYFSMWLIAVSSNIQLLQCFWCSSQIVCDIKKRSCNNSRFKSVSWFSLTGERLDGNCEKAALIASSTSGPCSNINKANSARAGNTHDTERVNFYYTNT